MNPTREFQDGKSMMMDEDGQPSLVTLVTRQSKSDPSRVKAMLLLGDPADGPTAVAPLPFAEAIGCGGWTPEWRMEMN